MSNSTVGFWEAVNVRVKDEVLDGERHLFLRHPLIEHTMYTPYNLFDRYAHQLAFIDSELGSEETNRLLNDEPDLGAPAIYSYRDGLECSGNSIQMLYHLVYWQYQTGRKIEELESVLEWGGGYGSLCRLALKINPDLEYTIIDTSVFSELQDWYLSSVGLPQVRCATLDQVDLDQENYDLFLSTWALSESPRDIMELVASRAGVALAPHVFVAYQVSQEKFESAGDVVKILNKYRSAPITTIEPVPYLNAGDKYAVL